MLEPDDRRKLLDEEHLRLLRIAYLIHGGTYAAFALLPLIYVPIGLVLMSVVPASAKNPNPQLFGLFFVLIGIAVSAGMAMYGGLQLYAARCLRMRRSRTLCLVAAVVTCLQIPLGTALGVFTFIVLGRPTVQDMFTDGSAPRSFAPAPMSAAPPVR